MNPNAPENLEFIKQYPFVSDILSAPMEPYDGGGGTSVNDLTIHVEKTGGDLMFRQANNCGLGDYSFVFQLTDDRKDQIMRRGEYLFTIDGRGNIINRVNWPRNDDERGETGEIYGWSALWAHRIELVDNRSSYTNSIWAKIKSFWLALWSGRSVFLNYKTGGYADPIWDKVKYLVWVTVEAWHTNTHNDDVPGGRFGKFLDRSINITIYGEPDEGFEKLKEESSVYANLSLDNRVMMRGEVDKNRDIISMSGMLHEMCITFQDEVYFNGMKEVLDGDKYGDVSGQFGAVEVYMHGYDSVMLKDATSHVIFQLHSNSKQMYVLGQQGTLPQIRNLVRTVVRMWNQNPKVRAAFKPDKNASVM